MKKNDPKSKIGQRFKKVFIGHMLLDGYMWILCLPISTDLEIREAYSYIGGCLPVYYSESIKIVLKQGKQ